MTQLESLAAYRCPAYESYPSIPLYKDQVLAFLNQALAPLTGEETAVTSAMINNYVKMKVLPPPEHKKYSRDQVVCLYVINLCKQVLRMDEIRLLLSLAFPPENVEGGYLRFCACLEAELQALRDASPLPAPEEQPLLGAVVRSLVYRLYASALLEESART